MINKNKIVELKFSMSESMEKYIDQVILFNI